LFLEGFRLCFERIRDNRILPIFDERDISLGLGGGHVVMIPLESYQRIRYQSWVLYSED